MQTNRLSRHSRYARRVRQEGMTLVEILIVLVIIGLIATAVTVAVLPMFRKGQIKTATSDAQSLRSAVILYMGDNAGSGCPTVTDLVQGKYVDSQKRTTDPWGHAFTIDCSGGDVTVVSPGPDGQPGTQDDITTAQNQQQ